MNSGQKFLLYAIVIGVILMVFSLYTQPAFLVLLANQIWTCF